MTGQLWCIDHDCAVRPGRECLECVRERLDLNDRRRKRRGLLTWQRRSQ